MASERIQMVHWVAVACCKQVLSEHREGGSDKVT